MPPLWFSGTPTGLRDLRFQFCFTERGWHRGRKIFFDTLAVQFPEVNQCDVFTEGKAKAGAVPDLEGYDKCTVQEEIASGQDIGICSNDLQVRTH